MQSQAKAAFQIGAWRANPTTGEISCNRETIRLETRAMLLLEFLAERAGEVVSIEELLDRVWTGVTVSPDSVYQAIASLRRQLGDDPKQPVYIATVPRLGYRMVARVTRLENAADFSDARSRALVTNATSSIWAKWAISAVVLVSFAVLVTWALLVRSRTAESVPSSSVLASRNQKSIAVLPFLDLTDGMKEEEFADGMTEELIDRLSKVCDFRVPAATASFYFKGKQVPLPEIAKALGVIYVLDGSVRKSAKRFRVAARLVRVENGYVMWSETYDRPLVDKLLVQEDIAGEVAKALRASIENRP